MNVKKIATLLAAATLLSWAAFAEEEESTVEGEYMSSMEDVVVQELSNSDELENKLIDYTIDDDLIYMGIAYSVSDEAFDRIEELAYKHGIGYYDMFNVHLDRETVIKIPQISRDELNNPNNKKNKGFLSKLFGRK